VAAKNRGPLLSVYSPNVLEGEFSELRLEGALRSRPFVGEWSASELRRVVRRRLLENEPPIMGEPASWQRRVEEFVLGQIGDPPARVLEVGCGEGELARALARVATP
jgi:2-polyprenyl-3-methyl-5-hydroxy-6-metoxy-1,4-benzoquinol methylase